jgi:regulator of protease activity HflC (stomatin/prohibitin superfamily)
MSIAPLEGQIQGDDSVYARTSDGQQVLIDASIIFALNPVEVINIHINWKSGYELGLVRPVSRGVIRDEASQFRIDEIVSEKRVELSENITDELAEKLEAEGLILVDFVMRNIQFTDEYAASVEQKQIAEQRALEAEFTVEQRRQEALQAIEVAEGQKQAAILAAEGRAEARIIEAEAEKAALELIAAALRDNPDLLTFEYIQKLSPGIQVMLVPTDNPFLLPLPGLDGTTVETAPPAE